MVQTASKPNGSPARTVLTLPGGSRQLDFSVMPQGVEHVPLTAAQQDLVVATPSVMPQGVQGPGTSTGVVCCASPNGQAQTVKSKRCPPAPLTSAQQDLVAATIPLARWVAKRLGWRCSQEDRKDLAQTASLALCKAARRFDQTKGVSFASYAAPACKRAVRDEMNERLGVVALPRWLFRKEGRGHVLQALVGRARQIGPIGLGNEPNAAQYIADDHLDAEALLAWLPADDRAILAAWLGGETLRHIAARLGRRRWSVGQAVHRILGELRDRANR